MKKSLKNIGERLKNSLTANLKRVSISAKRLKRVLRATLLSVREALKMEKFLKILDGALLVGLCALAGAFIMNYTPGGAWRDSVVLLAILLAYHRLIR